MSNQGQPRAANGPLRMQQAKLDEAEAKAYEETALISTAFPKLASSMSSSAQLATTSARSSSSQPSECSSPMSRPAALQQDWCYGAAMQTLGADVRRVGILDGNTLVGLAQFTTRRIAGVVRLALCSRGPVWLEDVDAAGKAAAYRAFKRGLAACGCQHGFILAHDACVPGSDEVCRHLHGSATRFDRGLSECVCARGAVPSAQEREHAQEVISKEEMAEQQMEQVPLQQEVAEQQGPLQQAL